MEESVLEIVEFRVIGAESDLRQAAEALEPWLRAQPGFRWRRLCQLDGGLMIDCIEWADSPSAQAAARALMEEPLGAAMMAHIDPASVMMRHGAVVLSQ